MKKLLDYDWSRAVQLLCNSVQKCVISCNYNLKAYKQSKCRSFYDNDEDMNCLSRKRSHKLISQSKCRSFYDNDEGMSNCPCTHELSRHCHVLLFHRHIFIIFFMYMINK